MNGLKTPLQIQADSASIVVDGNVTLEIPDRAEAGKKPTYVLLTVSGRCGFKPMPDATTITPAIASRCSPGAPLVLNVLGMTNIAFSETTATDPTATITPLENEA